MGSCLRGNDDKPSQIAVPAINKKMTGAGRGIAARQSMWAAASIGRRHDLDLRHHAPVLMLEDVAVIDELFHCNLTAT
jgi:hypothetical protein